MSHIKIMNPQKPSHPRWLLWAVFAISVANLVRGTI